MNNIVTVRSVLRFVLVGAVLLTGACSSNNKNAGAAEVCPKVGVLADASQLVEFSGAAGDVGGVVYRANIVNAAIRCQYTKRWVDLTLILQFHAVRGPSSLGRAYQFRYFVAVTDPSENILAKEVFKLPLQFPSAENEAVLRDKVERIRIPMKKKRKETGMAYQVLVGFDLTPDQVIYNRVNLGLN